MNKFVRKIVDRIMEVEGKSQQDVGAQIFEKTKQVFSRQISTNKLDFEKLTAWAVSKNVDLNWLITGQGTAPGKRHDDEKSKTASANSAVEHSNLIKQFQDKALAIFDQDSADFEKMTFRFMLKTMMYRLEGLELTLQEKLQEFGDRLELIENKKKSGKGQTGTNSNQ
jgi:hypothetical protein